MFFYVILWKVMKIDIIVTIPKAEYKNDDLETNAFLSEPDSIQFWTMNRTPIKLQIGDRVYFVRNNYIESSMKVVEILKDVVKKCDVTGRTWQGKCVLILNDLKYVDHPLKIKGFRGFRYYEGS